MITVDKPKVAKDRGYVLKTSLLEAALREAGLTGDVVLHYWTPQGDSSILEAEFWLPNEPRPMTLFVRAGSLLRADVGRAREQLLLVVLPHFTRWLASLHLLPVGSLVLAAKPRFEAFYRSGSVHLEQVPAETSPGA